MVVVAVRVREVVVPLRRPPLPPLLLPPRQHRGLHEDRHVQRDRRRRRRHPRRRPPDVPGLPRPQKDGSAVQRVGGDRHAEHRHREALGGAPRGVLGELGEAGSGVEGRGEPGDGGARPLGGGGDWGGGGGRRRDGGGGAAALASVPPPPGEAVVEELLLLLMLGSRGGSGERLLRGAR